MLDRYAVSLFDQQELQGPTMSGEPLTAPVGGYVHKKISADERFDLLSHASSLSKWDLFWNYTINGLQTGSDYSTKALQKVTRKDIDSAIAASEAGKEAGYTGFVYTPKCYDIVSAIFLIAPQDVSSFYSAVCDAEYTKADVYLFHYDKKDYVAKKVGLVTYDASGKYAAMPHSVAYCDSTFYAQEWVYFNFDIISLGYGDEGVVNFRIPVVSDPSDNIPDISEPFVPDPVESEKWWSKIMGVFKTILLFALVVILFPILIRLLGLIFDLIKILFDGIRALLRLIFFRRKKKKRDHEDKR